MSVLIGLVGPKGSGKSTLAKLLVERGFTRHPLAGPLKSMLRALLLEQGVPPDTIAEMVDGSLKEQPSPHLAGRTPRHAMQTLGTEWGRDLIAQDFWLDAWSARARVTPRVVCDDVRFLNEAARVRELGGVLVRITRTGAGEGDPHPSEAEMGLIGVHHEIHNPRGAPLEMLAQLMAQGARV